VAFLEATKELPVPISNESIAKLSTLNPEICAFVDEAAKASERIIEIDLFIIKARASGHQLCVCYKSVPREYSTRTDLPETILPIYTKI